MHQRTGIYQAALKYLVKPTVVGAPSLTTSPQTYFVLEHASSCTPPILKNLLPGLSDKHILFAHADGTDTLNDALRCLLKVQRSNPGQNIQLIPVSIFFGHLPNRPKGVIQHLFSEHWTPGNKISKALRVMLNGRNTLINTGQAIQLNHYIEHHEPDNASQDCGRKLSRVLKAHFQITRRTVIGPDLSHRRTLLNTILASKDVQRAIDTHCEQYGNNRLHAEQYCQTTLKGIAADFHPGVARCLHASITALLKRFYPNGVHTWEFERLRTLSGTHQLVYLPCHRSHMDYLLLSWALYREGLMLPHVAAGDNLNIPVIGPLLKRSGAIFMRRSFRNDQLYRQLYQSYLDAMSRHGHALEYFIEGGRSRSGRLLSARTGLLEMTLASSQHTSARPIALVPVWIGYDRIPESLSYQQELSGKQKQGESLSGVLNASRLLRHRYGSAYLTCGTPIILQTGSPEPPTAHRLGKQVLREINRHCSVLPIQLIATILLSTNRRQLDRRICSKHCQHLLDLLHHLPDTNVYRDAHATHNADQWLEQAISHQLVSEAHNKICANQGQARELTFYRNNIQHLLVLPGLYLLMARRLGATRSQTISRMMRELYPILDAELTLPWTPETLTRNLRSMRDHLLSQGLLVNEHGRWQAPDTALSQHLMLTAEPVLLRYYLTIRIIDRYGEISKTDLLNESVRLAEKLHQTYGYDAPEYADKRVFQSFIQTGIEAGLFQSQPHGEHLQLTEDPTPLLKLARRILSPHLIVAIDQRLKTAG